jgi:hypothetical protein
MALTRQLNRREWLGAASGALLTACASGTARPGPTIEFTRIPQADSGGHEKNDIIEGVVKSARPGQQVVLYARSGKWWIQPLRTQPFTSIANTGKWTNATHLGTEYAALLVNPGFHPPLSCDALPARGGDVAAIAVSPGASKPPSPIISFSGYDWRLRDAPSSRGGTNLYSPANVTVDPAGAIHLRMKKAGADWICSEMSLSRSLGYGAYRFVVRDISHLEPSMVFSIFTWDYSGGLPTHREMDLELSRWGDPAAPNGHYVVQPFHVPANVAHFKAPKGKLIHTMKWEQGRLTFRTTSDGAAGAREVLVAEHVFTSGVPVPGIESVRMNHYAYHQGAPIQASESEVVVEQFEYLP